MRRRTFGAIADLVREHGVTLVVVGHPLLLSGEAGERAHHAERFAAALTGLLDVPVLLQDERLSTVEAERALRETGASGRDRRRAVDRSAATVILQAWLDTDRPALTRPNGCARTEPGSRPGPLCCLADAGRPPSAAR